MSDLTDRLDEIEARADAATEGPWEWHPYMGSGATLAKPNHPFHERNILKTTDDWPPVADDAEFIAHARTDIPALLAEVRRLQAAADRVRALHVPFRIYDECECEDTTTPGHVDIEEVGITCNLLYVACRECCTSGVDIRYQTEDCACGHDHRDAYCPTIAALDGDEQ